MLKFVLYWLVRQRRVFVLNVTDVIWLPAAWWRRARLLGLLQRSLSVSRVLSWHWEPSTWEVLREIFPAKTLWKRSMMVMLSMKNYVLLSTRKITERPVTWLLDVWQSCVYWIRTRILYWFLMLSLTVLNCSWRMDRRSARVNCFANGTRSMLWSLPNSPVRLGWKTWSRVKPIRKNPMKPPDLGRWSLSSSVTRWKRLLCVSMMRKETRWRVTTYR